MLSLIIRRNKMSNTTIKGYKLPERCTECFAINYNPNRRWLNYMGWQEGAYICYFTGNLIDNRKRDDACPLVDSKEEYNEDI